jgi:hypothetical protein
MKTFNLNSDEWDATRDRDGWRCSGTLAGERIGGELLGATMSQIEPGSRLWAYHTHYLNEAADQSPGTPNGAGGVANLTLWPGTLGTRGTAVGATELPSAFRTLSAPSSAPQCLCPSQIRRRGVLIAPLSHPLRAAQSLC